MNLCAVIPAAGRGTRLGADRPKLLVEVAPGLSIWRVLSANVRTVADHVNVVVSPDGRKVLEAALDPDRDADVSISIQPKPIGMGDAIFRGRDVWRNAESILVIWGDQVHVSHETLARAATAHREVRGPRLTLPVARMAQPYVEYAFDDADGRLVRVLQSREGDACCPNGWGDVGTFLLSAAGLQSAWDDYLRPAPSGASTGEINFLPFLAFLSQEKRWPVLRIVVENADEARGINTPEDLAFFRDLYRPDKAAAAAP
jgi:bifunctional UDP-N-acetylglucosamine pyrophosphorylase / glucosamine-1-phosphate N-acetyltransferase